MKTVVYYFTGTGNSFKIAKDLQNSLENCEIINIFNKTKNVNLKEKDNIGLVFPIHMFGVPNAVIQFIKQLPFSDKHYFFAIANYGGKTPIFTFNDLLKILKNKKVKTGFMQIIKMPINYTPFFGAIPEKMQNRLFKREESFIEEISKTIKKNEILKFKKTPFNLFSLLLPLFALVRKMVKKMDKKFYITDKCNGCTICEKVCPLNNIKIVENKPIWQHNCSQCFACISWCPQSAIEYGKSTIGKTRYHNPNISIDEIMLRR